MEILYLTGEGYFIFSVMTCCYPAVALEWLLFNICLIGLNQFAETTVDSLKEISAFTLYSLLSPCYFLLGGSCCKACVC